MSVPTLAFTQGDPAGVGPEVVLKVLAGWAALAPHERSWRPLVVAERAALEALRPSLPAAPWDALRYLGRGSAEAAAFGQDEIPVLDPVARSRRVTPGHPSPADAAGALAALDAAVELARSGAVAALITAPLSKAQIARHVQPGFRGHTDHLAATCGLEAYGRDYLMAFLAPQLRVALLTTHLPLRRALDEVRRRSIVAALRCLGRHVEGKIAVAGLNPHAGEEGLLGSEEAEEIAPAVAEARAAGLDVAGPESPDSLFARARRGAFDWVLALYHDQGLIAVKTAAFGSATNWTLGLPFLRTSVDHGTAYDVAGHGRADAGPLESVVATTLELLARDRERTL